MSSKIMITYKRKRVTSQDHTADDTVVDSSPAASSNVVASNLPPKFEAHAENTIANEDNFVRNLSLFLVLLLLSFLSLCSTLTHSQPNLSTNDTPLLKCSVENPLDTDDKDKVATVRCTGLSTQDERTPEQKNSHIVKSSVQHMVPQIAEGGNQNMTLEDDGTPVSKFTCVQEVTEQDARVGDSSKTSLITVEAPKGIHVLGEGHAIEQTRSVQSPRQNVNVSWLKSNNKSAAEDIPESQGSTKNVQIIVLDDDSDERGKKLENSEALDQDLHNQNKRNSLGMIDLNCSELREEGFLHDSSIQKLPDQDLVGSAQKQMSQPIERMFFTKEKDTIHGKQQQYEGPTMHTSFSNFFDLTRPWNTGSLKGPKSPPSELKFRIMDRAPEFSLDLSLDSLQANSVSALRNDKLFTGGTSSISNKLTERLGTYSYKRHSAPWSEEELDFLWIGVRRYGVNNWNAMLRDTRLRFSNSRMPDDLAKQWNKEQKKLLTSGLGPAPPLHVTEDYLGRASCSGCSQSPFLGTQMDLSLGDVYRCHTRASDRGQHNLSSLGILNIHGSDGRARNLSLGGFPGASSSHGRSGSRRRRASKLQKSYYDSKSPWFQEPSERAPQPFPMNQQPINSLPQWLTKHVEIGTSQINQEMWPSLAPAPGHSAADPPRDSLRGNAPPFADDVKPHVLSDASLKRAMRRNADWRSFSKRLFQTGDSLDLNQGTRAAANAGPSNCVTPNDTGASSEETVSDS
ncbi:hypothetical protein HU200_002599 [Digitaria exilis]|uniref:Myb-like domain-containing protein n=1 Tax=Digitaria exilis TaxID=1010633 RepID=A0A835FVK9_9POAL|nr:hypothetical protein HU200_002599 [Digitaria exilis]